MQAISSQRLILLLGTVFALGSLGIDTILPALPAVAKDLHLSGTDRAALLVTAFGLGMGLGNLLGGPLSDSHGRKVIILAGVTLYGFSASAASFAPELGILLVARMLQGIGASFATVAATALVRDVHSGAAMARVVSFAMIVFAMMPAVAPFLGTWIVSLTGWRSIFLIFAGFAVVLFGFVVFGIPETLSRPAPMSARKLLADAHAVLKAPLVRPAIKAQTLNFTILFSVLSCIQPIFGETFGREASFPGWFAVMALFIATAGVINGRLVEATGALTLSGRAFSGQAVSSILAAVVLAFLHDRSTAAFVVFLTWGASTFFAHGFTIGNLSAMALEHVGDRAGIASTLVASIPLMAGVVLASFVAFVAHAIPGVLAAAVGTCAIMARIDLGKSRPEAARN